MKHYQTKDSTGHLLHETSHMPAIRKPATPKKARVIAGIISAFLLVNICMAADRQDTSARARYDYEKSLCIKGQTNQSKETCLREAGAALQQSRSNGLTTESEDQLQRNRERRCEAHPPAEREYCLQRMRGEGTQSGSAERGGILRELVVPVKPGQ
ncbi:hypothetical protein [Undibacterium sp. TS12]|uniref:hypothetical protein n=1 Tax=Undibacterium sp. TS12 TaxID=2908202 RepID=UPI001F4CAFF9|nr:hypothetical protein [Undibacterium sp. TS12]MCH8619598.1 hypothetical protein [Undibacterium sp. TS12]